MGAIYAACVVAAILLVALSEPGILIAIPVGLAAMVGVMQLLIRLTDPPQRPPP